MPLQSNPEVINQFIQKMGLKTEQYAFSEMLSTEEWAIEMLPKPVLGILFLYEETPVQKQHKEQESHHLKPEEAPPSVFFMKQYARNACGTIALFHIALNAAATFPDLIAPGSYLANFKLNSSNIDPKARGELFKESKDILQEHKQAVQEGQSSVQNECDSHFIAFVVVEGRLYELDGMKSAPVDHGPCTQEELAAKGSSVITQFMQRDPENLNFSMIVLTPVQEQA